VNENLKYTKDKTIREISFNGAVETVLYGEKLLCVTDNGITIYYK